jgi:glutathione S-transferase
MAGLVPAIHVFGKVSKEGVDARDKRGHDESGASGMTLKLFELVGADETRPFSPFCWRTRMALAHKGLDAASIPWRFTEKAAISPHGSDKVPVLLNGDEAVVDSWVIANYLEDKYPDRPSLFGGAGGRAVGRMINWWGDVTVVGGMFPLIVADIPSHLLPVDADYFRKSREARLGRPLEEVRAGRETAVAGFRKSLDPMRLTLKTQPYLGGDQPNYADYIVFGGFQWARVVSPFKLLEANDPIYAWREKMLDAFDGMARTSPGYSV